MPVVAPLAHRYETVNGVRLHFVEMGQGPLVLFLHGFPEFWYCWRHQLPKVAAAGYRAVAVDLRGYNESEKPIGIQKYRLEEVAADIVALCGKLSKEPVTLVAHDFGGLVAWTVGMAHPEILRKLIILNSPFPAVYAKNFRRPSQIVKSWYTIFHQLPVLPEVCWRAFHFGILRWILRHDPSETNAFTNEDIDRYVEALSKPGALTAALNYYRAVRIPWGLKGWIGNARVVPVPTLLLWGERDRYLSTFLIDGTEEWVTNLRVVRLPQASHWVQSDAPEEVTNQILKFLRE